MHIPTKSLLADLVYEIMDDWDSKLLATSVHLIIELFKEGEITDGLEQGENAAWWSAVEKTVKRYKQYPETVRLAEYIEHKMERMKDGQKKAEEAGDLPDGVGFGIVT